MPYAFTAMGAANGLPSSHCPQKGGQRLTPISAQRLYLTFHALLRQGHSLRQSYVIPSQAALGAP